MSARSTLEALAAPFARPLARSQRPPVEGRGGAWCEAESEREETESWQRERRGKSESRDGDGGGVLIDGSLI